MALTAKKVYAILKRQISDMEAKLNSPVRYRGTVATADLLPLNPDIGDMYNIESKSIYGEAGMNVAWNGVVWDTMGAPIDMSLYLTKEEAERVIQRLVTEYFEKNPVKPGATTEQAQQIEQNKTDIASLKTETGSLKEDLDNLENALELPKEICVLKPSNIQNGYIIDLNDTIRTHELCTLYKYDVTNINSVYICHRGIASLPVYCLEKNGAISHFVANYDVWCGEVDTSNADILYLNMVSIYTPSLCERCASHLGEYDHIALSLKKHKFYSESNPTGWKLTYMTCKKSELDQKEIETIKSFADKGFQMYNITAGGQSAGKQVTGQYKPPKTYMQGVQQGKKSLARELSHIIDTHLQVSLKPEKQNNKVSIRAFEKFQNLIDEKTYEKES